MSIEVADLRKTDRFVFVHPPTGAFGTADVTVIDIGLAGVQIQHPHALRIGTFARLSFRCGSEIVNMQGRVIWSHFLQTPGGLVYRSGVRVQADPDFAASVGVFARTGLAHKDEASLERKRKRQLEREKASQTTSRVRVLPTNDGS